MITIVPDTNIFLRFLTNDIPGQARKVESIFRKASQGKIQLVIYPLVVIEIIFHLERWYKYNKQDAVDKVLSLLSPEWMEVVDKNIVFEALNLYKKSKIDFVDVLLYSFARTNNYRILSFDKDFDSLDTKIRMNF